MIRFLSLVGRTSIMFAATLIALGFAIAAYVDSDLHPYLVAYGFERQLGALLGLAVGIMVAGIILGPLAALYDIRGTTCGVWCSSGMADPCRLRGAAAIAQAQHRYAESPG
jgi:hypothetical protein